MGRLPVAMREPPGGESSRIALVCGNSSFDHELLSTSVRFINE